ncbi:hypothetical protein [Aeromicrobium sp. Root495]|uniref:hypothetical protein n=1 Tax=Aeromicrobium sp. Root495 TaxID=1736550 RepID=UPI000A835772|nr:hypothetical protein [Aeromicrobium sp. Root495]
MSSQAERLVRPEERGDGAEVPVGRRVATGTTKGRSFFRRREARPRHRRPGPAVD